MIKAKKKEKRVSKRSSPDGRGKRPKDINKLAKWIVEKSTSDENDAKN